jgi:hypothetical protein
VWRLIPTIENADPAEREAGGANILFISGATPDWLATHVSREGLALLGDDSVFLTLGVFSIVIISGFEEVTREIIDLCTRHGFAYENWHSPEPPEIRRGTEIYSGSHIDCVNPAEFKITGQSSRNTISRTLFSHASIQADETVGLMALELYALLAVIETRSAGGSFAVLSEDASEIEAMVAELTQREEDSPAADLTSEPGSEAQTDAIRTAHMSPQELLLTLNAALSRLASQALSGTSPILQTECHFWPHSLLGIGVASLALRNVASFITHVVRDAQYSPSFKDTLKAPARWKPDAVVGRKDMPPYLDQRSEAVAELPGLTAASTSHEALDRDHELTPTPVTFYSGRDGFRNDILTMSVPLPSVSGCNSYQWNLGTITHELGHRIIAGKIEDLLTGLLATIKAAKLSSKADVRSFFARPPITIRDQAERLLGFTLAALHSEDMDAKEWTSRLSNPFLIFKDAKDLYSVTIEETLVHVFDFYHLCGGDTKSYVDFVWLSWAVQPRIAQRQDEYIKRTITALAIKYFEAENWQELAIGEFRRILGEAPLCNRLSMQPAILSALEHQEDYQEHLTKMRYLLELFYLVFKSDSLHSLARTEGLPAPKLGGGTKPRARKAYGYSATQGIFQSDNPGVPDTKFTNPLRFLRDYSRSHKPNAALSAWLLHMLAFNYKPEGPGKS